MNQTLKDLFKDLEDYKESIQDSLNAIVDIKEDIQRLRALEDQTQAQILKELTQTNIITKEELLANRD